MGLPSLCLAVPYSLAEMVHTPYWVELYDPGRPIDRRAFCEALFTYRCGDPAAEGQIFLDAIYSKGKARKLFPTEQRARAFLYVVEHMGVAGTSSPFLYDMPDLPQLPRPSVTNRANDRAK